MDTKFPAANFDDLPQYWDAYRAQVEQAGASVDRGRLAAAAGVLLETINADRSVYVCGNGGSAALANHLTCDLLTGVQTDTRLRAKVVSLTANDAITMGIANDFGFHEVFAYQLRTVARPGDTLLCISTSGESENVVRAAEWAVQNGLRVVALTGNSGGRCAPLATVNVHVASRNTGVVEDVFLTILHVWAQYLRLAHMPPELIPTRKF